MNNEKQQVNVTNAAADKKNKKFKGLAKKIAENIILMVGISSVMTGAVCAYLNYETTLGTLSNTMNETSQLAADMVDKALDEYIAIAYETGSIARLADETRPVEDKQAIIEQRIKSHNLDGGLLLDSTGRNIFDGTDYSGTDNFKQAMQGNNYVDTPAMNQQTGKIQVMVSAPLWEGGIPNTKPIGAVVYIPDGEFLNDIMRSIEIGEKGHAFLLDRNGTNIADPDSSLVGVENIIEQAKSDSALNSLAVLEERMIRGEDGYGYYSYNGVRKIASFSPVPDTEDWSIAVVAVTGNFMSQFYISIIVTIILVLTFMVLGVVLGAKTGRKIAAPIGQCLERLQLLSEGDLDTQVPEVHTADETEMLLSVLGSTIHSLQDVVSDISGQIGSLAMGDFTVQVNRVYAGDFEQISISMKQIISSLNEAMKEIDGNADRVRGGSGDLSRASQTLAEGASDQASAIQELTATITDISEKIQDTSVRADEVKKHVDGMNNELHQSSGHMHEMTGAMEKIKDSSGQIANIIKSIEDIATQTNLLSLNAAIEAARAGEAGRGFAVVADEVRQLAEQSAQAAKTTTELIENSIRAVEEGTALSEVTADSLQQVVNIAGQVTAAIDEISAAAVVQASAAQQVTEGVNQIANVVESNSATAQECSASSEELSTEANLLKELLEKFKYA